MALKKYGFDLFTVGLLEVMICNLFIIKEKSIAYVVEWLA